MRFRPPTLREYLILKYSGDLKEILDTVLGISGDGVRTPEGIKSFLTGYLSDVERVRQSDESMIIPVYPADTGQEEYYKCYTSDIKVASDYTRLSFSEILDLDVFTYWRYLHDAVIWNCQKTKEGREFLENAWYFKQTEPDRAALRKKFGG